MRLLGVDQERDPVGQHARLAAAGAGQNQQRALPMGDRLALGLVQALQQTLDPCFPVRRYLARGTGRVGFGGRSGGAVELGHPASG